MATHRHISVSFSIAALLLLTSSSPLSTVAEEDGGGSRSEWKDDGISNFTENTPITWKYGLVWTKSSLKASRKSFTSLTYAASQSQIPLLLFIVYSYMPHRRAIMCWLNHGPCYVCGKAASIKSLNDRRDTKTPRKDRVW